MKKHRCKLNKNLLMIVALVMIACIFCACAKRKESGKKSEADIASEIPDAIYVTNGAPATETPERTEATSTETAGSDDLLSFETETTLPAETDATSATLSTTIQPTETEKSENETPTSEGTSRPVATDSTQETPVSTSQATNVANLSTATPAIASTATPTPAIVAVPTASAPESGYDSDNPTVIRLSNSGSTVSNDNGAVSVANGDVYVLAAGIYNVSGSLTDHSIIVKAPESDKVEINLCGVTISSNVNHPIYVESADKVEISAQSGTVNTINDNRTADDMSSATGGAIYSCADLEIKGKGSLTVNASYNNGIATKDDLVIKNLTLKVTAPNNALKGNDTVTVESGNITAVSTLGDGIKTEGTDVSDKGNQRGVVTISGGTLNVYAACDAIDASYDAVITGGTINAYTESYSSYSGEVSNTSSSDVYLRFSTRSGGGGRPGSSSSSSSFSYSSYKYSARFTMSDGTYSWVNFAQDSTAGNYVYYSAKKPSGASKITIFAYSSSQTAGQATDYAFCTDVLAVNTAYDTLAYSSSVSSSKTFTFSWTDYTTSAPGGMNDGNANASEYSCKGIKADNSITISGGTITIKSHDDAIHANNDVLLEDGVSYGKGTINISGGVLNLSSDDDGVHADGTLNISGGKIAVAKSYEGVEAPYINFKGGTLNITSSDDAINACGSTSAKVTITGGIIYFNAGGDGLDSNGTITMSDGVVMAQGPSSGGNGVLDFDGSFNFEGGFLLTVGCSGMNQKPTAASGNTVLTKNISTSTSSYVVVTIENVNVAVLKITKNSQNYCVLAYNNAEYGSGTATISVTSSVSEALTDGLYYVVD